MLLTKLNTTVKKNKTKSRYGIDASLLKLGPKVRFKAATKKDS